MHKVLIAILRAVLFKKVFLKFRIKLSLMSHQNPIKDFLSPPKNDSKHDESIHAFKKYKLF